MKADPKEPNVHFGLGYLLWTQNQFEEAAQQFQAELANVPDHAQALAFLADSDMQLNRSGEAMPLIQKALKIDPNPHWRLARLYQAMGNKAEANLEFQKTSNLHKLENETIMSKLKAAQEKGKPAEGESEGTKP